MMLFIHPYLQMTLILLVLYFTFYSYILAFYLFMVHHYKNSLSSLHIFIHHCTFSFIIAHFHSSLHIFIHHCTFSFITAHFHSSLHIFIHHCTFFASLHV